MKTTKHKPVTVRKASSGEANYLNKLYEFSFRDRVLPLACFDRMAMECIDWYEEHPEAFTLEAWLKTKKMSYKVWNSYCSKYEIIKEVNEYILMVIGDRREHGALHKKLSENMVAFSMPAYSERWRNLMALRSNLTVPQTEEATAAIPTIPLTDDVRKQLANSNDKDNTPGSVPTP